MPDDDVIDVPERDPGMNPSIEDRLSSVERQIDRIEEQAEFAPTVDDIRSLEKADLIILGCLVCLTVLAWYATRASGATPA